MVVGRRALNISILIRRCCSSKMFYSKSSCQTKSSSRRNLSVTVQEPTIPQRAVVVASSIQGKMTSPQMRRRMTRGLLSIHSRLLRGRSRGSSGKRRQKRKVSVMRYHGQQSAVVMAMRKMEVWDIVNTYTIQVISKKKTAKLERRSKDSMNSRVSGQEQPRLSRPSSAM